MLLSTLCGGAAFAHGVAVARATSRAAAAAAVAEEASRAAAPRYDVEAVPEAEPPVPRPELPREVAHAPVEEPMSAAAPAREPPSNPLDDALAALPAEPAAAGTPASFGEPSLAPCVQRRLRLAPATPTNTSVWGPDHDRDGNLHVKPFKWGTSTASNRPASLPPCPQVRFQPVRGGPPAGMAGPPSRALGVGPQSSGAPAPTRGFFTQRGGAGSAR